MIDYAIDWIGGNCPVQAEGSIDGKRFYFRARGDSWSFRVGETEDDAVDGKIFYHEEGYGDGPYAAGWMSEGEARSFIEKAAGVYMIREESH